MNLVTLRIILFILAGSLALQSYQCSSPDFTTGKSKFNNRDFAGANDYLTKEVQKNPGNAEAWLLLARTRKALVPPDFKGAADALTEAEKNAASVHTKADLARESYYLWVDLYNAGINEYNDFFKSSENGNPQHVSALLDMASILRPENADVYTLNAAVYLDKKDTSRALSYLAKYVEETKNNYDFAVSHKFSNKTKRANIITEFGNPLMTKGQKYGKDSVLIDKFTVDGKETYVYSVLRKEGSFIVDGWNYNLPSARTDAEKERYTPFDIRPYIQLAAIHYNRKEFDPALKYIDLAAAIDPADDQTNELRVAIYEAQGKTAEVLKSYEEILKTDPNNTVVLSNYGAMLNRAGNFDKAIEQLEKVLALDPNNENALFNIAAAYKNKASEVQKSEKQKADATPKYKENEELYFPSLRKSAEYFQRYKNMPAHRTEFAVLQQLANVYEVVRDKPKLKEIIAELESVEFANENNAAYYNLMGSLYLKQNQIDKSKKYFDKETELLKK